jgi:hypothetical protein
MFSPDLEISQPLLVRVGAVATTAYVAGTTFSMDAHNALGLQIDYTKGNETSLDLKLEVSNDGGATYAQECAENTSSGTITESLAARAFAATGIYSIMVHPMRARLVKISVKTTYGTVSTGSCSIKAYPLWV